jgi:hypothetical protein
VPSYAASLQTCVTTQTLLNDHIALCKFNYYLVHMGRGNYAGLPEKVIEVMLI